MEPTITKEEYELVAEILGNEVAKREIGLCTEEEEKQLQFVIDTCKKVGAILVKHKGAVAESVKAPDS